MDSLYTIGHSNHPMEKFLQLLAAHNIAQVVDVRTFPQSRHCPHYNEAELREALRAAGIEYVWAGKELGGRSGKSKAELRHTAGFRQALRELIRKSQEKPTAMMCAEEDPVQCHRRYLISRALMEDLAFAEIEHIRKDATLMREPGFPDSAVQLTLGMD